MLPTRVSYSDSAGVAWIQTPVGVGGRPVTGRRGGLVLQGRGRGRTALSSRLHLRQSAGFWGTPCFSGTQPAAAVSPSHTPSLWKLQASAAPTVPSDAAMRQGRDRASSVAERSYRDPSVGVGGGGGPGGGATGGRQLAPAALSGDRGGIGRSRRHQRPGGGAAVRGVARPRCTLSGEVGTVARTARVAGAHAALLRRGATAVPGDALLGHDRLAGPAARCLHLPLGVGRGEGSGAGVWRTVVGAAAVGAAAGTAQRSRVAGRIRRQRQRGHHRQRGLAGCAQRHRRAPHSQPAARAQGHRLAGVAAVVRRVDGPTRLGGHHCGHWLYRLGLGAAHADHAGAQRIGSVGVDICAAGAFAGVHHMDRCGRGVFGGSACRARRGGDSALHPDTLAPVLQTGIPVRIRNTFRPERSGTEIGPSPPKNADAAAATDAADGNSHDGKLAARKAALGITAGVKGFTSVRDISVLNVEGAGMIGVPGIAGRAFSALYEADVSVVLIAQASSEFSICLAVPGRDGDRAAEALRRAFRFELADGIINSIELIPQCSIVAMVGENMQFQPGVSSRLFASLAKAGVNIRAIAQGSSEHNISVVVFASDERQALRAAHAAFYLGDHAISVGILGPGLVGGTLVDQIREQRAKLRDESGVDFRIRAVANRTHMLLLRGAEDGVSDGDLDAQWRELFQARGEPLQMDRFVAHVNDGTLPHAVVADCTASEEIGARYVEWLRAGPAVQRDRAARQGARLHRTGPARGPRGHGRRAQLGAGVAEPGERRVDRGVYAPPARARRAAGAAGQRGAPGGQGVTVRGGGGCAGRPMCGGAAALSGHAPVRQPAGQR
eukprot:ctg_2088.g424